MNMRGVMFLFLLGLGAASASGCCSTDPASSAKCKASPNSEACSTCCKTAGRNGHSYVSSTCSCM